MSVCIGRAFEKEILGRSVKPGFGNRHGTQNRFWDAVDEAIGRQPLRWKSFFPDQPPVLKRLFWLVYRQLRKMLSKRDADRLRLYVSVGTSLDLHGVDFFFLIYPLAIATLDLSLRVKEGAQLKANFLLTRLDLEKDRFGRDLRLRQLAKLIATRLRRVHTGDLADSRMPAS